MLYIEQRPQHPNTTTLHDGQHPSAMQSSDTSTQAGTGTRDIYASTACADEERQHRRRRPNSDSLVNTRQHRSAHRRGEEERTNAVAAAGTVARTAGTQPRLDAEADRPPAAAAAVSSGSEHPGPGVGRRLLDDPRGPWPVVVIAIVVLVAVAWCRLGRGRCVLLALSGSDVALIIPPLVHTTGGRKTQE